MGEAGYKVIAAVFVGERELARFPTREQAEWRVRELNNRAERNPRGFVQYAARPVAKTSSRADALEARHAVLAMLLGFSS